MASSRHVLIRVELNNGMIRRCFVRTDIARDMQGHHVGLCRAFGLDECSTWFDMSNSIRDVDPTHLRMQGRQIGGYVHQGPPGSEPIGKIVVCHPDEHFRDWHAEDKDYLRLGW